MKQKYFSINVWILFGVSIGLILFTFILVAHNENTPNKINQDRDNLLGGSKTVLDRIKPIGQVNLSS
jgi:hypothetical protein